MTTAPRPRSPRPSPRPSHRPLSDYALVGEASRRAVEAGLAAAEVPERETVRDGREQDGARGETEPPTAGNATHPPGRTRADRIDAIREGT